MAIEHQVAEKPQRENIIRQLTKLGNTPYECSDVALPADFNYFIPSSQLAELRGGLVSSFEPWGCRKYPPSGPPDGPTSHLAAFSTRSPLAPQPHLQHRQPRSRRFLRRRRADGLRAAPPPDAMLMQCRHCLRLFALGFCVKHGGERPTWHEPLYLRLGDGRRFRLEFDCRNCQMNVYAVDYLVLCISPPAADLLLQPRPADA